MTDANYPLPAEDIDDLPRTLRRQREEMDARRAGASTYGTPEPTMPAAQGEEYGSGGVTVRRFEVPFLHMVAFFLKAVLAAIPALILLGLMLWAAGHVVQVYFPQLLKMQILIWFPNNP